MRVAIKKDNPKVRYYYVRDYAATHGLWLVRGKQLVGITWDDFKRTHSRSFVCRESFSEYYKATKQ